MYWRLERREFNLQKGEQNKQALRSMVEAGQTPGILAYCGGRPAGWCCVGPRDTFPALARSRVLKPVDDRPVWSVVCFFVAKPYRRQGLSVELLKAAASFAAGHGARIVEGYPVDPYSTSMPAPFAYTGLTSAFLSAGFAEVARRSGARPIMRMETA